MPTGAEGHRNRGDTWSRRPALDRDGDTMAFVSQATNLVPDDANGTPDAFVVRLRK